MTEPKNRGGRPPLPEAERLIPLSIRVPVQLMTGLAMLEDLFDVPASVIARRLLHQRVTQWFEDAEEQEIAAIIRQEP